MSKYTVGPWRVNYRDGSDGAVVASEASDVFIAKIRRGCGCCETGLPLSEEEIANINILSAAPELLEALKEIVQQWDTPNWKLTEHTGVFINKARAAIKKAEGGV